MYNFYRFTLSMLVCKCFPPPLTLAFSSPICVIFLFTSLRSGTDAFVTVCTVKPYWTILWIAYSIFVSIWFLLFVWSMYVFVLVVCSFSHMYLICTFLFLLLFLHLIIPFRTQGVTTLSMHSVAYPRTRSPLITLIVFASCSSLNRCWYSL